MKRSILVSALVITFLLLSSESMEAQHTGIFINNQEVNATTLMHLQKFSGRLYQGYYYLDQYGNFGIVGYYPSFNLVQRMQQYMAVNQGSRPEVGQRRNANRNLGNSRSVGREGRTSWSSNNRSGGSVASEGTKDGTGIGTDGKVLNLPN